MIYDRLCACGTALLGIGLACSVHALSLDVENGEIIGVRDVEIQGKRYDLTFVDGAFNAVYPAGYGGYARLARDAAQALVGASESGEMHSDPGWQRGLRPRGCASGESCTVLIPDHTQGAAPSAETTYAVEVIYAQGRFRSVTAKLWPFHAAADTAYMPDMLYAILAPARVP